MEGRETVSYALAAQPMAVRASRPRTTDNPAATRHRNQERSVHSEREFRRDRGAPTDVRSDEELEHDLPWQARGRDPRLRARLTTTPVRRIVPNVTKATPSRSRGAALIAALALSGEHAAKPHQSKAAASGGRRKLHEPDQCRGLQREAQLGRPRAPIRSATRPLNGPTT